MKHLPLFLIFIAIHFSVSAQSPVLKIDVNVDEARKESEVNEPGYTPRKLGKDIMSDTATFEGVQFTISLDKLTRTKVNLNHQDGNNLIIQSKA